MTETQFIEVKSIPEPSWNLLMDSLGFQKPWKCIYCGEEVSYPMMGLYPSAEYVGGNITCGSIVCTTEAISEMEKERNQND